MPFTEATSIFLVVTMATTRTNQDTTLQQKISAKK